MLFRSSQAPLCHYTLRTVTNRPEGTFRSLRYTFGGDHPSQTTHQTVSSQQRVRTQIDRKSTRLNSSQKSVLLQPQDVTSRHRGAKPLRRYELLGGISLLSPEYLLSFERCPFHTETPDHYALVSYLIDLLVSQSSALMPLHSKAGYQSAGGHL